MFETEKKNLFLFLILLIFNDFSIFWLRSNEMFSIIFKVKKYFFERYWFFSQKKIFFLLQNAHFQPLPSSNTWCWFLDYTDNWCIFWGNISCPQMSMPSSGRTPASTVGWWRPLSRWRLSEKVFEFKNFSENWNFFENSNRPKRIFKKNLKIETKNFSNQFFHSNI